MSEDMTLRKQIEKMERFLLHTNTGCCVKGHYIQRFIRDFILGYTTSDNNPNFPKYEELERELQSLNGRRSIHILDPFDISECIEHLQVLLSEPMEHLLPYRYVYEVMQAFDPAGHCKSTILMVEREEIQERYKLDKKCMQSQLIEATKSNNIAEVADLIYGGVGVNTNDSEGKTPLMIACMEGYTKIVKLLLACLKIDINAEDRSGKTALELARDCKREYIVELIERFKAKYQPFNNIEEVKEIASNLVNEYKRATFNNKDQYDVIKQQTLIFNKAHDDIREMIACLIDDTIGYLTTQNEENENE